MPTQEEKTKQERLNHTEVLVALAKLETMQSVMLERLRLMADKEIEFKAAISLLKDEVKGVNEKIYDIKAKMSYAAGAILVVTSVVGIIVNLIIKKFV